MYFSNEVEELNNRETFLDFYYSLISQAKSIILRSKQVGSDSNDGMSNVSQDLRQNSVNSGQVNSVNLDQLNSLNLSQINSQIKLPTIQLPNFKGSYENWLEFHDTFDSLIHKNASINSIQKFHYHRASLSGEAAQVVSSLETLAANYDIAWNLLCERFTNTRLLIHNHTEALFGLQPIQKESSFHLRQMIDNMSKNHVH